uniref:uncharacterized protein LOC122604367 n=1 Tax=Erigeron canadensis TaxID=72917 RepID=UPI001CB981C6|nr:uncharacterized protein LOC122604367 [Erigeron canadensis]
MLAGFSRTSVVADIIQNAEWKWPTSWLDLFPVLINIPNVQLSSLQDVYYWKDFKGKEVDFSSGMVWESVRSRKDEVQWYKAVWFSQMIPRHSFLMWLIFRRKLKTQDKIMRWSAGGNMNYNLVCDSLVTRHLAFLQNVQPKWDDITRWLVQRGNSNSAWTVIGKLLIAATSYFIWQERNSKLFSNKSRQVDQIRDLIASTVQLKLVTLRFKNIVMVNRFIEAWNLPRQLMVKRDED